MIPIGQICSCEENARFKKQEAVHPNFIVHLTFLLKTVHDMRNVEKDSLAANKK